MLKRQHFIAFWLVERRANCQFADKAFKVQEIFCNQVLIVRHPREICMKFEHHTPLNWLFWWCRAFMINCLSFHFMIEHKIIKAVLMGHSYCTPLVLLEDGTISVSNSFVLLNIFIMKSFVINLVLYIIRLLKWNTTQQVTCRSIYLSVYAYLRYSIYFFHQFLVI